MRQILYIIIMCLALLGAGCRKENASSSMPEEKSTAVDKDWTRGPLALRLHLDRTELNLDERLTVRLEAEAPEGVKIELPSFGEGTEQFLMETYHTIEPKLTEAGTVVLGREYILEPLLAEDYVLPVMAVKFHGRLADGGDTDVHELSTEPQRIKVNLPPQEVWDNLQIDDETDAQLLELRRTVSRTWIWVAAGAAVLLVVAICVYGVLRRRRKEVEIVRISPQEAALAALQRLVAEDLVSQGALKEFYNRISSILREYVEARYDLHAPERTTEEFMEDLRQDKEHLTPEQKSLLEKFLKHCDLVKFAKHEPDTQEIQATFDVCKNLITES